MQNIPGGIADMLSKAYERRLRRHAYQDGEFEIREAINMRLAQEFGDDNGN